MKNDKKIDLGPALGYDPNFGQLDTRGLPLGTQLENIAEADNDGKDPFLPDDKFGQLDVSGQGLGSKELKRFISNLPNDNETIGEIQQTSPQLAEELRQAGLRDFHFSGWVITPTRTTGNKIHCTAESADREEILNFAIKATTQDELMEKSMEHIREVTGPPAPTIRDLTEKEILFIQRQAQSGDMRSAICNYLKFRIGEAAFGNSDDPWDLLGEPAYRDVTNDAAYDCWRWNNNHYVRNEEFEAWLRNVAAQKPLTVEVINALHYQWQENREHKKRSALLGIGETPTPAEAPTAASITDSFDSLSDQEIEDLKSATLRERFRQVRAARGR